MPLQRKRKDKESEKHLEGIKTISKEDSYYLIKYQTGEQAKVNILNSHVFRYHMSPKGEFPDYPQPDNPNSTAKIVIKSTEEYGPEAFQNSHLIENEANYIIDVLKIKIIFNRIIGTMSIIDKRPDKVVLLETEPISYGNENVTQTIYQNIDEHFFGGGMQNGRFTHKGEVIDIVNTNKWDDGGVTSPCPFYWSSNGYGVLRNTWQPGSYNFGNKLLKNVIQTTHNGDDFDAYYFISSQPKDILKNYYELTGQPRLMPEYAFYEAHLNAFNRDYWVKTSPNTKGAILFEDGYYYKCYQPSEIGDKVGILESLNGEKDNYQFSAPAMIDRYKMHDLPLGWFVPNDGYGCGYGQTDSLDGDIKNLKEFGVYARENGVELAVWTESNLHPADPQHPKKGERDLDKEVSVAGVVALKADVAWIGYGYSFGLNAMQNAVDTFLEAGNHSIRPMVITVDGWAGTQRCAGIWSGDQSGGEWEYIRFHIPTYIGSGLSGLPNVGSDMDGIFRGGNRKVNIRDFQWKAFTPIQLNMDGWGWVQKTPFAFDDEATSINRGYLKLKSILMPYNYTIGHESIHGLPMIRAMFLEFPGENLAYTKHSQYQFMWGPNFLIAPIYNEEEDVDENSVRNGIYLPASNQIWIDFLTGEKYQGGIIFNNYKCPIWKMPVFVKHGAIIPVCNPNNNPNEIKRHNRNFYLYPNGESVFELYEDDGISTDYLERKHSSTNIKMIAPTSNKEGNLYISISKTVGFYKGIVKEKTTEFNIMASKEIEHINVAINGEIVALQKAKTKKDYESNENVYYFDQDFVINPYLVEVSKEKLTQSFLLVKIGKLNVMENEIQIKIKGFVANGDNIIGAQIETVEDIRIPSEVFVSENEITSNSVTLRWKEVEYAIGYEVERDDVLYTNIKGTFTTFSNFDYNSRHILRVRAVGENGVSKWSNYVHATTKDDPYKFVITNVKATCSLPCQKNQDINKLTTTDMNTIWHTNWGEQGKFNIGNNCFLKINFDLGDAYDVHKFEYYPRQDVGNGTFLKIQYRTSTDGSVWSELSDVINWNRDESSKMVKLGGLKMRFIEITVLQSVGNFGSGRAILFYQK